MKRNKKQETRNLENETRNPKPKTVQIYSVTSTSHPAVALNELGISNWSLAE